ncbi:probable sugar phosphate/phosphate translocator At1g06470 isoform X1 [Neltuma alba]|uniref:probable sugar phosphate/phosphate translocator At1g06470 isoform X1 n=3 Tax=Neltuma alba TaxID=207710 RepID=UPI0010A31FE9|nr:probable sugar phosphate/phosphate translocator At1g06470 isoform X1 [Prosopis alba]XP_028778491.1 probable sugar phosphate/phosphate translocator At1g06470 isoform X1 [Prosopis alba]
MHMKGIGNMDNESVHLRATGTEKHVPFDIENGTARGTISVGSPISVNSHGSLEKISRNSFSVLKTLFFILLWYSCSLFLTLYNKTLLGHDLGKFPAPLLMNTVHFAMQAVVSKFIIWFWSHKFPTSVVMSWSDYFLRVVPTALGTAMDVNLSNASLVSISVTFATMCKSGAPIFLLLFAFAFRLETPSFKLSGIMIIISIGILMTVAKDTEFEFWGFVLVMLAAVMSGFRWCMTQILLQKETYGLKDPLALMSYVTPVMAVATALLSLAMDPWDEFQDNNYFDNPSHISRSCLLMIFGGALAFLMVLTEYILVSVTSAVTVTVAGVVKEAVTILVAVLYFHDEFTWLKGYGLITIMVGVSLFNWYKYWKLKKGHASEDLTGGSPKDSVANYVILEEREEEHDSLE